MHFSRKAISIATSFNLSKRPLCEKCPAQPHVCIIQGHRHGPRWMRICSTKWAMVPGIIALHGSEALEVIVKAICAPEQGDGVRSFGQFYISEL